MGWLLMSREGWNTRAIPLLHVYAFQGKEKEGGEAIPGYRV
jgi:hypothetical protein